VPATAVLLYKSKLILNSGLVEEITIWSVKDRALYPNGFMYRLILVDPIWKKPLVLFENQTPNDHHQDDFKSVLLLIKEFKKKVETTEHQYENNEN
jgi:hypothetical protein